MEKFGSLGGKRAERRVFMASATGLCVLGCAAAVWPVVAYTVLACVVAAAAIGTAGWLAYVQVRVGGRRSGSASSPSAHVLPFWSRGERHRRDCPPDEDSSTARAAA